MQRVKVGMTGLASVLLIIALASAVLSWASKEPPVNAAGSPKADVVADLAQSNTSEPTVPDKPKEPLAELGVAPSAAADPALSNATAPEPEQP